MTTSRLGRSAWVIVWCLVASSAAAQSPRMELSIAAGSTEAGALARVPIQLRSPIGIGAAQFEIVYDPAIVRFKGVEHGALLPTGFVEANVVQPGRARVALVSSEEVKGTGVLLLADFDVLAGPAGDTAIGLEAVRGWDQASNLPVHAASQAGQWTRTAAASVASGQPAAPQRPPAAGGSPAWHYAVVAGIILLVLGYLLGRRTPTRP
ncbi:MAG: hypothetical protein JNM56_26680 [Planctomycetia bacterium]|nr:hypothetical protein [Planctomycetia bacterium]